MAKMDECLECGKAFNDGEGLGFCGVCWFEIEARKPPEHLVNMRSVSGGREPENAGQRLLRQMMEKNPDRFLSRLEKAESDWREQVIRVKEDRGGPIGKDAEEEIEDKSSESLEAVIRELLGVEGEHDVS